MPMGEKYILDNLLVAFLIKREKPLAIILIRNGDAAAMRIVMTVGVVKILSEDKIIEIAVVTDNVIKR